eukprot:2128418-Pleurochrysis_carterae.AAC.1
MQRTIMLMHHGSPALTCAGLPGSKNLLQTRRTQARRKIRVASLVAQVIGPAYDGRGDTARKGKVHTHGPRSRSTRVPARTTIHIGCQP